MISNRPGRDCIVIIAALSSTLSLKLQLDQTSPVLTELGLGTLINFLTVGLRSIH
jgi:hypothetical protein